MRRRIEVVPSALPHARLYLDDIESIEQIFKDSILKAIKAEATDNSRTVPELDTTYVMGREEMDSIDDLLEQGGSSTRFHFEVHARESYRYCLLSLNGPSSLPSVYSYGIDNAGEWGLHAKVAAVFKRRSMPIRNLLEGLPSGVKVGAWTVAGAMTWILAKVQTTSHPLLWNVIAITYLAYVLLLVAAAFILMLRPSRVYFVRSHERSKASRERRKQYVIRAITFGSGIIFIELVHYVFARFNK
jgi:hypothetical protein